MSIALQLAEHVASTSYGTLPADAVRAAKASLVDTLAVSIAARRAPGVSEVIDVALADGGRPASSIWTRQERVPARAAAFTNSFLASALDFDSLHQEGVAHADIVIVPTAIAVGEAMAASGKAIVAAVAVGDDVLCRLCRSTRGNTGWFYTSLYGPLASASITASLLGGSTREVAAAMGIASMSAAGTQQPAVERSMGKRMQGALAAGAGVTAGYLARNGLDGPTEVIEGRFGLYAMHENGNPAAITADLGTRFQNSRIGYKLYPSCQCNHAAIEGMLQLRAADDVSHETVKHVEVTVSPYMQRLVGASFDPTGNPQVAAQFSVQYSIASVLLYGRLGVNEISADAVRDPRIRDIAQRVSVVVDASNKNNYAPVRLRVTKTDGRTVEHEVTTYRGSDELPLTDDDLRYKLAMCIEAAGASARPAKVDAVFDAVMNIEETSDISRFVSSLLQRCLA